MCIRDRDNTPLILVDGFEVGSLNDIPPTDVEMCIRDSDSRNPRFGLGAKVRKNGECDGDYVDFRNNVIYNWGMNSRCV